MRHSSDDLTLYEPVRHQPNGASDLASTLLFKKTANTALAKSPEDTPRDETAEPPRFVPLRRCDNVNGYSTVFLPGPSPSFVLKSCKSTPKVIGLQGLGVGGMSAFHTEGCDRGFIYADSEGIARVTQLPEATNLTELGISVKKIPLDSDVGKISYHHPTGTYIAGCSAMEPFELPRDDDYHKEWVKEALSFPPTMPRGVLRLINPVTWTVIHSLELEPCESIESMRTLQLEVSEETKERRMLVTVGSALSKGEDLPTRGRVQVFDIVTVIPEPGRPETNRRLKLMAKEEIPRGGVTALSEVGTQGLMLVAQGQKCMVRGLKEDGSLLPVAFLDMNCHVASVRELPGTGLCLLADAFKGLWFAGYTEEPYTFKVLGKSGGRLPLLVADFLPDGEDLSMVAVDADGDMHILEFNPERTCPGSPVQGERLSRLTVSQIPRVCRATSSSTAPPSPSPQTRPHAPSCSRVLSRHPRRSNTSSNNSRRRRRARTSSSSPHHRATSPPSPRCPSRRTGASSRPPTSCSRPWRPTAACTPRPTACRIRSSTTHARSPWASRRPRLRAAPSSTGRCSRAGRSSGRPSRQRWRARAATTPLPTCAPTSRPCWAGPAWPTFEAVYLCLCSLSMYFVVQVLRGTGRPQAFPSRLCANHMPSSCQSEYDATPVGGGTADKTPSPRRRPLYPTAA